MKRKLATWAVDYRWVVLIVTALLIGLFWWKMMGAVILNDPDDWSNQKHPYVKLNKEILHQFGGANILQIMVKVKDGGKYPDIYNLDTLTRVKEIADRVYIMKGFIPPNFEGITAPKVKYFKATEEMIIIEQLMAETPKTQEDIARIKEGVQLNPFVYGKLVSKDFKGTLMMADYNREIALDEIYLEALAIKEKYTDENHEISISGKPVQMGWLNEQQKIEMPLAFLFLFIVTAIVLYCSFRNFRGVVLPLVVGIIGSIVGMGTVAWTGVAFNIISYGSPFIILAAGAAHVVQYLKRFQEIYGEERDKRQAAIDANVHIMPPLVISVVTDALGFIIIIFTPFSNLINMAVGSAAGLISMLYLVIFFVPAVVSFMPPPSEKAIKMASAEEESALGSFLGTVARKGFHDWRFRFFIPVAVAVAGSLWFCHEKLYIGGFDWDTAIYSNIAHRWQRIWVYKDQEDIAKTFAGCYPYNILIEGKEPDVMKDPALLQQIERMQDWLETRKEITYTISLPNYLRGMNILFHEGNMEFNKVPDDPLLNSQYLYMLSTGSPGEFETTVDTVTWQNAALKTLCSCGNPRCYDKLVWETLAWAKENWTYEKAVPRIAGGFIGVSASMSEDAQKYLIPLLIALVLLIYTLVAMLFRDLFFPVYLVAPLLCGLAVMMGPLAYLTMSAKDVVDYNAQQFISLCLGVGIDANVYLLFRYFEEMAKSKDAAAAMERAWTTTGKAVLYSALSLSLAYIPLCFVKTFWAYLGWGSLMILLLNSFASLVILPTILGVFRPRFLFRSDIKIVQS